MQADAMDASAGRAENRKVSFKSPVPDPPVYIKASTWQGAKDGYVFTTLEQGTGYYHEEGMRKAERARIAAEQAKVAAAAAKDLEERKAAREANGSSKMPPSHPTVKTVEQLRTALGPLPPIAEIGNTDYSGPETWTNWVIPDRVLAGIYPGNRDDAIHIDNIEALLQIGIEVVVCVQNELNHKCPPEKWQRGFPFLRPYISDMNYIHNILMQDQGKQPSKDGVQLIHVNMPENGVCEDLFLDKALKLVVKQMLRGKRVYIHGWAGHGRVGVLTALLLNRLYATPATAAMNYAQLMHDQRLECMQDSTKYRSPGTRQQRQQVQRMCTKGSPPRRTARPKVGSAAASRAGPGSLSRSRTTLKKGTAGRQRSALAAERTAAARESPPPLTAAQKAKLKGLPQHLKLSRPSKASQAKVKASPYGSKPVGTGRAKKVGGGNRLGSAGKRVIPKIATST